MEQIYIKESPKGTFSCEIGITTKEWLSILNDNNITTENYKEALMAFYNEKEHKASCMELSVKHYGNEKDAQRYNSWITQFGIAVTKKLNRFTVIDNNGKEKFWCIAMSHGTELSNGLFQWTMRNELVQAIENLGWNKKLSWIPFFVEFADKLLQFKDNRKELVNIIYGLDMKFVNYIKGKNDNTVKDIDPFSVYGIFNRGITKQNRIEIARYFKSRLDMTADVPLDFEGVPMANNMLAVFSKYDTVNEIQPLWNLFESALRNDRKETSRNFDAVRKQHGIKWNITMGLFWARPYDYIPLDSRSREYLPQIGINVFNESQLDSEHYFNLLDSIKSRLDSHAIKENNIPEISISAWYNSNKHSTWLVGYSIGSNNPQDSRFIKDSVWEGIYMDNAKSDQKLLKETQEIKIGDVIILKSTSTKGKNHDQPFLRIKGVGIVSSDIVVKKIKDATSCSCNVTYLSSEEKDFDGSSYGSYRKTIHKLKTEHKELKDYINSILGKEETHMSKYEKYIKLLKTNKNLVLTGAPGTGKTYMAQAMAKEMDAEVKFVQFHPSYDYTDFVEGLRPVSNSNNGQLGFERRDGVFKQFCREAIKNINDSEKSAETILKEHSWNDKLQQFVNDAIENNSYFTLSNHSRFTITDFDGDTLRTYNEQNEKVKNVSINANEIIELLTNEVELNIVKDIRSYFGRTFGTQADSYTFIIVREIRKMENIKPLTETELIRKKDFVLIIDEINRGEASKIFGELFYAIDPGYRGKKDVRVQTQYQNLVPESDVFAKGFYVPENVYILATMNDIDRSVESMDFAMRRRFTWKEICPDDTQDMLDYLGTGIASEAKNRMKRLNKAIADTDGLGAAYMIGPSYFLKLSEYQGDFTCLWEMNLEPLIKEYLRGFRKAEDIINNFKIVYFGENNNDHKDNDIIIDED